MATLPKVLIIDDDSEIHTLLTRVIKELTADICSSMTLHDGLEQLRTNYFDVVFLDVYFPDGSGIDIIESIKEIPSMPEIIVMTGASNTQDADRALNLNVWEYIPKSSAFHNNIKQSFVRALEYRRQNKARPSIKTELKSGLIIGESSVMLKCLKQVAYAAKNNMPVMVLGDTGTGKELFAKAIHANSDRQHGEFVVVDCSALPDHLVESILFGHIKGAFTGADLENTGLVKMADGGTLFLDEIGELPLEIQKKFLRVLQEKTYRPIGYKHEIKSDFRLVCATHCDLTAMAQKGDFRKDLYFRISSSKIRLPPLKERHGDVTLLANHYINIKNSRLKQEAFTMSKAFLQELETYNWPGNVRELKGVIDSACSQILYGEILFPNHLPKQIRFFNIKQQIAQEATQKPSSSKLIPLKEHIDKTKHEYILNLFAHTNGDIKASCQLSGLSRGHLYNLFNKYGIKQK